MIPSITCFLFFTYKYRLVQNIIPFSTTESKITIYYNRRLVAYSFRYSIYFFIS